jgi:uncharacterized protein (DUF433 family)
VSCLSASFEVNPDVQGGEPVIRGTRIPIRGLAKQIEAGEARDVLEREYGYIDPEAFEFAVAWAKANPRGPRDAPVIDRSEPLARARLRGKRRAGG